MSADVQSELNQRLSRDLAQDAGCPLATMFAIPKSFENPHTAMIQDNAIRSWMNLRPEFRVVLCGDDKGVADYARQNGLEHISGIRRNEHGTPLVSDAFQQVAASTDSSFLVYCNADVILMKDFVVAVQRLSEDDRLRSCLAFGRRHDLDVVTPVDVSNRESIQELLVRTRNHGRLAPIVCKEYFVATRDVIDGMPELAVGRGNWDNWMVASARKRKIPVISLTPCVTAIHQNHNYEHLGHSRMECYATGVEARQNEMAGGGKNIVLGSSATHTMTFEEIRRVRFAALCPAFWMDLPRFIGMVSRLPFQR